MKAIRIFIAIVAASIFTLTTMAQEPKKDAEVKYATSITCESCVNTIMSSLPLEKGIKDVKCDLETKTVTVTYKKDKNDPEKIKRAIEKLGYTAKEITDDKPVKK